MKKTIDDFNFNEKIAIIRVDFNVPLNDEGVITDSKRIEAAVPTIKEILSGGGKAILMSHLGRPKGKANPKFSLNQVVLGTEKLLGEKVLFLEDFTSLGVDAKKNIKENISEKVVLLENLRFNSDEEKNGKEFSKKLANLADIYVNDAFGTAHRAHASTEGIAKFLPSCIGRLMEKEVKFLGDTLANPKRPFVGILGGAKVSDKIRIIESLLEKVNSLIIGGGMAYTFLKAKGFKIGQSLLDETAISLADELMNSAEKNGIKFLLPIDFKIASEFSNDAETKIVDAENIPDDMQGLDIGPKTIKLFENEIKNAGTILWNGPMGVFEMSNFADGTIGIAKAMANAKSITIVGGGDSAAAAKEFGFANEMTHISTGGGASLEFIEKGTLPGLEAIEDKFL